ncbi:MAG: hypothetical protein ABF971_08340, partial [Zymomonas mobilis]|uniref:hypothetical protein n=1 Tax=Zymomonas mobilis TaxID=542 RepID=UPI0039E7D6EA
MMPFSFMTGERDSVLFFRKTALADGESFILKFFLNHRGQPALPRTSPKFLRLAKKNRDSPNEGEAALYAVTGPE